MALFPACGVLCVISRITGRLVRCSEDWVELAVGPLCYQLHVPESTRVRIQQQLGQEITLYTLQYLEGNPAQGRLVPRMLGFLSEAEREFFDLFCSVDGVGARKALRAMDRPVKDIATAIAEKDAKWLTTLPGIGAATADRIVAKLHRKMARFALLVAPGEEGPLPEEQRDLAAEGMEALVALGHSENEARRLVQAALSGKRKPKSVDDLLHLVYQQQRP